MKIKYHARKRSKQSDYLKLVFILTSCEFLKHKRKYENNEIIGKWQKRVNRKSCTYHNKAIGSRFQIENLKPNQWLVDKKTVQRETVCANFGNCMPYCKRCNICRHTYTCTCNTYRQFSTIICIHIHYLCINVISGQLKQDSLQSNSNDQLYSSLVMIREDTNITGQQIETNLHQKSPLPPDTLYGQVESVCQQENSYNPLSIAEGQLLYSEGQSCAYQPVTYQQSYTSQLYTNSQPTYSATQMYSVQTEYSDQQMFNTNQLDCSGQESDVKATLKKELSLLDIDSVTENESESLLKLLKKIRSNSDKSKSTSK